VGEIIDDGVTGLLIPPGDPAALAAAINRLAADAKLSKALAAAGNASAKARFSLKTSCAQLRAMADALAAGKAVPADG
jgi:glycosyltransferase involved in cell wall biosynthesis